MNGTPLLNISRNRDKRLYRWLFGLSFICLFLFFWLLVLKAVKLDLWPTVFSFAFLIGCTVLTGWRLNEEKEPPAAPDQ